LEGLVNFNYRSGKSHKEGGLQELKMNILNEIVKNERMGNGLDLQKYENYLKIEK
jgi:hypothetical protein